MPCNPETLRIGLLLDRPEGELGQGVARAALLPEVDVLSFCRDPSGPPLPFACLGYADAFGFSGVAVATDLVGAATLLGLPGPSARLFYVLEAEWASGPMAYEQMAAIYTHPQLRLVAPSEARRASLESLWNARVHAVVPPGRFDELVPLLRKTPLGQA